MLIRAAGRFVLKQSTRGQKGPLIEMCVKLRDRRLRHRWNLFNLCQPANHRQLCYIQLLHPWKAPRGEHIVWAKCAGLWYFLSYCRSWTDSFRLCSSAHVCWKGEHPSCLLLAFKSPFSLSYLVQPLLLLSLLTCRKPFQHRHKSSSGEGFLSSGNINKYVVVCSWIRDLTMNNQLTQLSSPQEGFDLSENVIGPVN